MAKKFTQFLADRLINELAPLCKKHRVDIKDCKITPKMYAKLCLILYASKYGKCIIKSKYAKIS